VKPAWQGRFLPIGAARLSSSFRSYGAKLRQKTKLGRLMLRTVFALTLLFHAAVGFAAPDDLLRLSPPASWGEWKIDGSKRTGNISLTSRSPAAPQFSQWKDSLVTFTFYPIGASENAVSALKQIVILENAVCEGLSVVPPKTTKDNRGFSVAYLQTHCRKHKGIGQGRLGFFKAISSSDRVFVVGVMKVVPSEAFGPAPGMFVGDDADWIVKWLATSGNYLNEKAFACAAASSPREACSE
jgi:hypothetical protein